MFDIQLLGENINFFRNKKGLTQQDMSIVLGISPQAISKWEKGLNAPDISLLPQIAETLNVTLDLLFKRNTSLAQFDSDAGDIWNEVLEILKRIIKPSTYNGFFAPTKATYEDDVLVVTGKAANFLYCFHSEDILKALETVTGNPDVKLILRTLPETKNKGRVYFQSC